MRETWEREGPDNRLFDDCFRIQREASEAAGRYIPMVVENVRGSRKWVGAPFKANYGSFVLYGDVGMVGKRIVRADAGFGAAGISNSGRVHAPKRALDDRRVNMPRHAPDGMVAKMADRTKIGGDWFSDPQSTCRKHGSRSSARKAASAQIAVIPPALSRHIAEIFWPGLPLDQARGQAGAEQFYRQYGLERR